MRGLGPYVINELTTGGAVRLETLDGEPLTSFINGSCLKRFHEPLTQDMLERMHAAKSRKQALQQLKDDAQVEAKERAAKAKARRMQISNLDLQTQEEEDYIAPLLISIGITSATTNFTAILDSGADVNVISAEMYKHLDTNELLPTSAIFNSFTNTESDCLGTLTTTMFLQGHQEVCTFYVSATVNCAHEVILGRSWMAKHKCSFDWDKQVIQLTLGNQRRSIAIKDALPSTSPKESVASTSQVREPTKIQHRQPLNPLTRRIVKPNAVRHRKPSKKTHQRWVPKRLLSAQGYYDGNQFLWLPKQRQQKRISTTERSKTTEGYTPIQKETTSSLHTSVADNSKPKRIATKMWQKKKTQPSIQEKASKDREIKPLIQEPSLKSLVLQSKDNMVDRKGKAKLNEGCNAATYSEIKPKPPPIQHERFLEPMKLQEEQQLSIELPIIEQKAKKEGNIVLPSLRKDQALKPKTVKSMSTTHTFYSVSANLSPWKTIKNWSANSQVADMITGWHKSLESGLSSQNVLGY